VHLHVNLRGAPRETPQHGQTGCREWAGLNRASPAEIAMAVRGMFQFSDFRCRREAFTVILPKGVSAGAGRFIRGIIPIFRVLERKEPR
jgi:hypothetical protein